MACNYWLPILFCIIALIIYFWPDIKNKFKGPAFIFLILLLICIPFAFADFNFCRSYKLKSKEGTNWGYGFDNTYGHYPVDLNVGYIGHDKDYLYLRWQFSGKMSCNSLLNAYIDLDPEEEFTFPEYIVNWILPDCENHPGLNMRETAIYDAQRYEISEDLTHEDWVYTPFYQGRSISGGSVEVRIPRDSFGLFDRTGVYMISDKTPTYGGTAPSYEDNYGKMVYEYPKSETDCDDYWDNDCDKFVDYEDSDCEIENQKGKAQYRRDPTPTNGGGDGSIKPIRTGEDFPGQSGSGVETTSTSKETSCYSWLFWILFALICLLIFKRLFKK